MVLRHLGSDSPAAAGLANDDLPLVAELCRRLGGLPRYLEFAAERTPGVTGRGFWIADARPYTVTEIVDTVGRALRDEGFDVKAPGFFAILALAQVCFGPSLATLKFVSIVFASVASCSIFAIGS